MSLKTITTAEPSIAPPPMPRHLVQIRDNPDPAEGVNPREVTLCGAPWDRLGVSPNGPLCDPCADEFKRRHGHPHYLDRRPS